MPPGSEVRIFAYSKSNFRGVVGPEAITACGKTFVHSCGRDTQIFLVDPFCLMIVVSLSWAVYQEQLIETRMQVVSKVHARNWTTTEGLSPVVTAD